MKEIYKPTGLTEQDAYVAFLNHEYHQMSRNGIEILQRDGIRPSDINPLTDQRPSLDLFYTPSMELRNIIKKSILSPLKKTFAELNSDQVVYEKDWLHFSLFILLAAETPENLKPPYDYIPRYKTAVTEAVYSFNPVSVQLNRVLLTNNAIVLTGYPKDLEIPRQRHAIYAALEKSKLPYFNRRPPYILHATLARWKTSMNPQSSMKIVEKINSLDNKDYWLGKLNSLNLALGTYVMQPDTLTPLKNFSL